VLPFFCSYITTGCRRLRYVYVG